MFAFIRWLLQPRALPPAPAPDPHPSFCMMDRSCCFVTSASVFNQSDPERVCDPLLLHDAALLLSSSAACQLRLPPSSLAPSL